MASLISTLLVVMFHILSLLHSAESSLKESRLLTNENDSPANVEPVFASPSNKYIQTRSPKSTALKVSSKISHPSVSPESISPDLFTAGTNARRTLQSALSADFQISTITTGDNQYPTIAALSGGGFVVTWYNTATPAKIYGRLYDSSAAAIGSDFQISTLATGDNYYPTIAALRGGGFVVTWYNTATPAKIYGRLYDSSAAAIGSEFQINTITTISNGYPTVATLRGGDFVVMWYDNAFPTNIHGRLYNNSTTASSIGSEFQIHTVSYANNPTVAALNGGGFVVTWQGGGNIFHGQLYSATASVIGSEFQFATDTSSNNYPTVATLTNGGFVVAWQGASNIIHGQLYSYSTTGASSIGSQFQINTVPYANNPTVAALNGGGFVVTWHGNASHAKIYGRLYDSSAAAIGSEFQISTIVTINNLFPTVATLSSGDYVVTWLLADSPNKIYGRLLTANVSPTSQPSGKPTSQPRTQPSQQPTTQPTRQPTRQPTSFISGTLNQGLVAYYPFDGNAHDQSGNGNNGEVHNATLTSDRFGNPNSAYRFDGSTSYIKVTNGLPFDFSNKFSVAFWIKPGASQLGWATVFSKSHYTTGGFGSSWFIEQGGTELNSYILSYRPSTSNVIPNSIGTQLIASQWNHYSVTKENTKLNSYLNGNLVHSLFGLGNDPIIYANGNLSLFIGTDDGAYGYYFHGLIDDIFIFNRTLTSQEIQKLYQFDAPTSQPTSQPTRLPSSQPSRQPSEKPTSRPSLRPIGKPTDHPSNQPTGHPTKDPTSQPSDQPTSKPDILPTNQPSGQPTSFPSGLPSQQPKSLPTGVPTTQPSDQPTCVPTVIPSIPPSGNPSSKPITQPSSVPSSQPSDQPTNVPVGLPTTQPTLQPTRIPSALPSSYPSSKPTRIPTCQPSSFPSNQPSSYPSSQPTSLPSKYPTCISTFGPTGHPTRQPSSSPTCLHSEYPSSQPSIHPTSQSFSLPSSQPTIYPTNTPTAYPSSKPSLSPSAQPSSFPSVFPSGQPSSPPSFKPSCTPFSVPSIQPSSRPSSQPSDNPTKFPAARPSNQPTDQPSHRPSRQPTCEPSHQPISHPSSQPTSSPISSFPTSIPTIFTESPTPLRNPSISAYPSQTRKPTRQPITPRPTVIPTVRPSYIPTSAPIQMISVFPSGNSHFKESLFFFGSYLPDVENIPSIYLTEDAIGSSYIIFGFKRKEGTSTEIIIGSRNSQGLYGAVTMEAGLRQDRAMSRTFLPIGDFNGDTYEDLLICDPINSMCFVYFGHDNRLQNLHVSFAIKSNNKDLFGWSVAKLNEVNKDSFHDIAISALSSNIIYLFFGSNSNIADVIIDQLDASIGIKIIGRRNDENSGLALSSAGDFNSDGFIDILFSAIQINPYQNIIYILFLNSKIMKQDIVLDNLTPNKDYFKIFAPLFSFAGFSLSNLGDINQDGFDDIIVGSIPYSGKYLTQKSYVIYGRNSSFTQMPLNEMTADDGFTIIGGGFMVGAPGDVNNDGIPDIMISSYQQWQGKRNGYIMVYPLSVTSPPTFLPSSQPSSSPSRFPSVFPSSRVNDPSSTPTYQETTNEPVSEGTFPPFLEATILPSLAPKTSKPTRVPSIKSTTYCPTIKTVPPSLQPSRKPSENPTRRPTLLPRSATPSRSPTTHTISSTFPTSSPSTLSTESPTAPFEEITIENEGVYKIPSGKVNCIITGEGSFDIRSNGGGKKIYTILPSNNVITITDFNKRYDQISLIHFPYLYSINDLVYRTNPLQIFLSREQRLILSSMGASELTEDNLIFQKDNDGHKMNANFHLDLSAVVSLGILIGCVGIFGCFTKLNQTDENVNYSLESYQEKSPVENVKQESDQELNENLSSDSGSFLVSSLDSEHDDGDSDKEGREPSEWNLSSLKSFFSSGHYSAENLEEKIDSVLDVFNVVDPEEEEEDQSFVFTESDDQQQSDDGNIDIEGHYKNNEGDDMDEDISFTRSFNNSLGEKQ
jgi:hypothetical protein